jgi:hypothetical protein
MDEDEEDEGRADDATMEAAEKDLSELIVKCANEYGMIMPDIVIVLIVAAVRLAFDTWKGPPEDAKRIIEDTVKSALDEAIADSRRHRPDGEPIQ